jgi:hypothetical protein
MFLMASCLQWSERGRRFVTTDFNSDPEYATRKVQEDKVGLVQNRPHQLLVCADMLIYYGEI